MLSDAIEFPTTADDWIQTVIIGGALTLLAALILPAIVVQGYTVRVARAGATGGTAPSFTDWGDLLVDGLRLLVVNVAMMLLFVVPVGIVLATGAIVGGVTGSRVVTGIVGLIGVLAVVVLALALSYVLPAAIANFAIEDSLAAAFDARTVADGALTGDYAIAWLLAILIGVGGGLVGGALSVLLVGFPILFYVQVVTYYLFGRGFAAGLGMDVTPRGAGAPAVSGGEGTRRTALGEADDPAPDPLSDRSGATVERDSRSEDDSRPEGHGPDAGDAGDRDASDDGAVDGTDRDERESDGSGVR
jgi:hypothetical protein